MGVSNSVIADYHARSGVKKKTRGTPGESNAREGRNCRRGRNVSGSLRN